MRKISVDDCHEDGKEKVAVSPTHVFEAWCEGSGVCWRSPPPPPLLLHSHSCHSHAHARAHTLTHTMMMMMDHHTTSDLSSRCLFQGALTCEARLFHLVDVHVIVTVAIAAHLGELIDARWCRCACGWRLRCMARPWWVAVDRGCSSSASGTPAPAATCRHRRCCC